MNVYEEAHSLERAIKKSEESQVHLPLLQFDSLFLRLLKALSYIHRSFHPVFHKGDNLQS